MNSEKIFKIFVDFDGTITKEDVGDAIFRRFGDTQFVNGVIEKLLNSTITARECWEILCSSTIILSADQLDEFIKNIEIDNTFHSFVDYCENKGIEVIVLSDGFDFYIDRIFRREKLGRIKYYSNKLTVTDEGKMIPAFPYYVDTYTKSANCKWAHIINHSSDDDFTVYIGDGNSDKETAQFCDFIFAKDDLLKYCEKERITYFPYNNFNDVTARIETLLSKKRLKKRHQAFLKRREAYIQE